MVHCRGLAALIIGTCLVYMRDDESNSAHICHDKEANCTTDHADGAMTPAISRESVLSLIFNKIGLETFQQAIERLKISSEFCSAQNTPRRGRSNFTVELYDRLFADEVNEMCELISKKIMSLFMQTAEGNSNGSVDPMSNKKIAHLKQIIQAQEAEIKSHKNSKQDMLNQAKKEIEELKSSQFSMEIDIAKKDERILRLQEEINALHLEKEDAKSKHKKVCAEAKEAKVQMVNSLDDLRKLGAEVAALKDENERLQRELETLPIMGTEIRNMKNQCSESDEHLKTSLRDLQSKHEDLRDEHEDLLILLGMQEAEKNKYIEHLRKQAGEAFVRLAKQEADAENQH